MSQPFNSIIPVDDRIVSLNEAAEAAGVSICTLRRRIDAGAGPHVIRLSERRVGIRVRDLKSWLDARTSPANVAE